MNMWLGFVILFKLKVSLQWSPESNDMNDTDIASCLLADRISKYLSEKKRVFLDYSERRSLMKTIIAAFVYHIPSSPK